MIHQRTDWQRKRLAECITIKHGYAFKGEHFVAEESDSILLTPGNFEIGGGFKAGKFKYYAGPIVQEYKLKSGDLVVTMTDLSKDGDTLGFPALVPDTPGKTYLHNQRIGLVKSASDQVDLGYIYYLMRTRDYQRNIVNSATGSTVRHTSPTKIGSFEFALPPLPEQRAIAAVLSSLDDKIELLREENKTLEQMAQVLFREWFVKFNFPDERGRPYRASGGKMVESELGEIPEGWRVGKLSDIADHIKETVTPSESESDMFSHYSIPAFDQGQRVEKQRGSTILSNKYKVPPDSLLVSKLNPQTPRVWMVQIPESNAVCSTEFQVIKPKENDKFAFVYSVLNSDEFSSILASKAHGTSSSHQRVSPQDILGVGTPMPYIFTLQEFHNSIFPILEKLGRSKLAIQTHSSFRDMLLPKLMLGELKV